MAKSTDPQIQTAHQVAGYRRFIGCMILLVVACMSIIAVWGVSSSLRPCRKLDLLFKRSGCVRVVDPEQSSLFRLSRDGGTILELIDNSKKQMNIVDIATGATREVRSDDGQYESGPGASMEDIALTHDGDYAAVVSRGYLGIVNLTDQLPVPMWIDLPEKAFAARVAVSPDEKLMAAAISDGNETYVSLYRFPDGEKVGDIKEAGKNYAVAFSPAGELLTAFGSQIQYWDVDSKAILKQFGEKLKVGTLMFTPDGRYLIVTTGNDYNFSSMDVEVFEPETTKQTYRFILDANDFQDLLVAVSADSATLAVAECKAINLYDLSDGSQIKSFFPHKEFSGLVAPCITGFQFAPDGNSYYYAWSGLSITQFRLEMK